MFAKRPAGPLCLLLALTLGHPVASLAADLSCNGLLAPGQTMICAGSGPNWGIEISCDGGLQSRFLDPFSSSDPNHDKRAPGSISFATENPWELETSHPIKGSIAYTPGGCVDEGDGVYDFTFTPTAAPGFNDRLYPFCCRIE